MNFVIGSLPYKKFFHPVLGGRGICHIFYLFILNQKINSALYLKISAKINFPELQRFSNPFIFKTETSCTSMMKF